MPLTADTSSVVSNRHGSSASGELEPPVPPTGDGLADANGADGLGLAEAARLALGLSVSTTCDGIGLAAVVVVGVPVATAPPPQATTANPLSSTKHRARPSMPARI